MTAVLTATVLALASVVVAADRSATAAGEPVTITPSLSPPPTLSTSGDYATDVLGDPWDFANDDIVPTVGVGAGFADSVDIAGGLLSVATRNATEIRLLMKWPAVLPWGRDGRLVPIDADRYSRATFRIFSEIDLSMAIRFERADGVWGVIPFVLPAGWSTHDIDLRDRRGYPFPEAAGVWSGDIVRFELFRGGSMTGGDPAVTVTLDWVRVRRSDAPTEAPSGVPVPRILSPSSEGGDDHATTLRGDAWDFATTGDVRSTHHLADLAVVGDELRATSTGNDPYVEFDLGPDLTPDRFRRLTVEACYSGGFSLSGDPGGGMVGRLAWMPRGTGTWTETQDFVVFPGCHRMTVDLVTDPASAVHDEGTRMVTGWRGIRIDALRFDPHEDPGPREVTVREVRLADDATLSTSYDIGFTDAASTAGTTAEIMVTTVRGSYDGTVVARVPVRAGVNTVRWDGTDETGAQLPNGSYWVTVVMRNAAGVGVAHSSGPVRVERPVGTVASRFVPVVPARLLDTRTGLGGNLTALGPGVVTELPVVGVGGVPSTGVSAVALNVTAVNPTSAGFLTLWPSRDPVPVVSNLNFVQGQVVPNLVTVKVGRNGRVDVLNSAGTTHVVADVVGYYTTDPVPGGLFTPLTPDRVLDTRDGTGRAGVIDPVGPEEHIDLAVTGRGGVPASGVDAVALNVTVDRPTAAGFVTVWPAGERMPLASTHNFVPGLSVANLVLAKVGTGGRVSLYNSAGDTQLVADVVGYFSVSGGAFVPVEPRRLVDTRDGTGGRRGALALQQSFAVALASGWPVPTDAVGVVGNVTAADTTETSFLTVWPEGEERPMASTLNPRPGVPVPNQAYVRLGPGGVEIYDNTGRSNVLVDVFGYFR
ncbi:MAG: hypothetical protein RI958_2276 [Actinomycetota bacterium]